MVFQDPSNKGLKFPPITAAIWTNPCPQWDGALLQRGSNLTKKITGVVVGVGVGVVGVVGAVGVVGVVGVVEVVGVVGLVAEVAEVVTSSL